MKNEIRFFFFALDENEGSVLFFLITNPTPFLAQKPAREGPVQA